MEGWHHPQKHKQIVVKMQDHQDGWESFLLNVSGYSVPKWRHYTIAFWDYFQNYNTGMLRQH